MLLKRGAKRIFAIDGCPVACAKKTVEQAGLKVTDLLRVTEEGFAKNHNLLLEQTDIEVITARAKNLLQQAVMS